jgi:predicted DNA-binding helix-hairpin-helix protein
MNMTTVNQKSDTTAKIIDRLEEFLSKKGDTIAALGKALKVSRGYFSTARLRSTEIGSDKLVNILQLYPDLSADWLLTGSGFMFKEAKTLTHLTALLDQSERMRVARDDLDKMQAHLASLQRQLGVGVKSVSRTAKAIGREKKGNSNC